MKMLVYIDEEEGNILTKLAGGGYFGFKEYQVIKSISERISEQTLRNTAIRTCEEDS